LFTLLLSELSAYGSAVCPTPEYAHSMFGLETDVFILLFISLFAACAFEFVNGFHDTANAVATVIYTNSLKPDYRRCLVGYL
jgi:hypothetical protein